MMKILKLVRRGEGPRLAPQRDEEEDGGEAVQHLTGLQLTLPSDTHIRGAQECSVADPDPGSGAFLAPGSGMGEK